MSGTAPRQTRAWHLRRRNWVPLLVLALGLVTTAAVTRGLGAAIARTDEERFQNRVQDRVAALTDRLNNYGALLRGAAGLFAAHPGTSLEEFRTYVDKLDLATHYPGMQGLGYTRRLRDAAEAQRLEAQMRAWYGGDVGLWPRDLREERHAIVYLEPLDRRNRVALGFDMSSESERRAAMTAARDRGNLAASGKVTLVQEIDRRKQPGFLLYMPVYAGGSVPATVAERRALLVGFAYSPFRVNDLLAGVYGEERRPRVGFELYDGASAEAGRRMYRSVGDAALASRARLSRTMLIQVAGRPWTVRYFSLPAFEETSERRLLPAVVGVGMLLSLLFAAIVAWQIRARESAEERQSALQTSTERLRIALQNAPLFLYTYDRELRYAWVHPQHPADRRPDELLGRRDDEILPAEEAAGAMALKRQVLERGRGLRRDVTARIDGGVRHYDLWAEPLRDATGAVIGGTVAALDVTERQTLLQQSERRAAQMRELAAVSLSLGSDLPLKAILQRVTDTARALIGAHQASSSLHADAGFPEDVLAHSLSEKYAAWQHYGTSPDGSGIYSLVCRENRAMRLTQAELEAHPLWRGFGAEGARHPPLRGWLAVPLIGRDGRNLGLMQLSDKCEGEFDAEDEAILTQLAQLAASAIENARLYTAVRAGEERLRLVMDSVTDHAIFTTDTAGIVTGWNVGAERIFGYQAAEMIGRSSELLFTPEDRAQQALQREMAAAIEGGVGLYEREHVRRDGSRFFASGSLQPLRDERGELRGFVKVVRDMTEQRQTARQRELLIAELNHRVKNSLAIVQSIAQQTRRTTHSAEAFHEAFIGRLHALARTHDLLTRERWEGASLEDILRETLAPHAHGGTLSGRVAMQGPPVRLVPGVAVSLSMAFHELATNAIKYGALSSSAGRVEIEWRLEPGLVLALEWRERGGPAVVAPRRRRGFGSRLIEQALARELAGEVALEFAPVGLVCRMRFPLSWLGRMG